MHNSSRSLHKSASPQSLLRKSSLKDLFYLVSPISAKNQQIVRCVILCIFLQYLKTALCNFTCSARTLILHFQKKTLKRTLGTSVAFSDMWQNQFFDNYISPKSPESAHKWDAFGNSDCPTWPPCQTELLSQQSQRTAGFPSLPKLPKNCKHHKIFSNKCMLIKGKIIYIKPEVIAVP